MSTAANLAPRDEAAEVLRCLQEMLREPAFASAVIVLVSNIGQDVERKDERGFVSGASAENGKG